MTYELVKEPEYRYHGSAWQTVRDEHRRDDQPFDRDRSLIREHPKCKSAIAFDWESIH